MCSEKVWVFDFDGTITRRDSLLEVIRFARGDAAFIGGMLMYSPLLVLMKAGLYPNWKAKQRVFGHFFGGMMEADFDAMCRDFAVKRRSIIRPGAAAKIKEGHEKGVRMMIVSASIDNWVKPFFSQIEVLGTKVEVIDGRLTGRFMTKNCYGEEKVRRIKEALSGPREAYCITAFGDSRGDKEMLCYADEGVYKPFRD